MPARHYKRQRTQYYCGPAVMQILLGVHGIKRTQTTLALKAKTTDLGTTPANLVSTLRKEGFAVVADENQTPAKLRAALRKGTYIIACITADDGDGHYVIVLAVTPTKVTILDTNDRRRIVELKLTDFIKRWQDKIHTKTHRFAAYIG